MKKALKVIAGVALAGCMLLPLAACSDTDNSEEVKQLQQQIQDLQTEIDSLKNGNGGNDLFAGSPKFIYSIEETISYYINGIKIFDLKINSFAFNDNGSKISYTVSFLSGLNLTAKDVFNANLYDEVTTTGYLPYAIENTEMYFKANKGNKMQIILYYMSSPFACIEATPTKISNFG